jgi:hypothetical protein
MDEEQRRITSRERRRASSRALSLESKLDSMLWDMFSNMDMVVVAFSYGFYLIKLSMNSFIIIDSSS